MGSITYAGSFWLFMLGNVLGVIIEGCWCRFRYGKWETHVVALWGPFNIVYGLGIVAFYLGCAALHAKPGWIRIGVLALAGSVLEYLCGWVIRVGLHMKAWDYRNHFLNFQGLISPKMTLLWGSLGMFFDRILYSPIHAFLSRMTGFGWQIACDLLSAFMVVNLFCTAMCIIRWARRHRGIPPISRIAKFIDRKYPDSWMEKKFCNWRFMDDVLTKATV